MQQETIDLPQTVDELQLANLRTREQLIEATAAREHLEQTLNSEVLLLQEQVALLLLNNAFQKGFGRTDTQTHAPMCFYAW
jgi:hypothetical protein